MDKLWVITQNSESRIAIDNYYYRTEPNSKIKYVISTRINNEVVDLGYYYNRDSVINIMHRMDEHLINVCDKFANPSNFLKNRDVVFHYISDIFFKMPPIENIKEGNIL